MPCASSRATNRAAYDAGSLTSSCSGDSGSASDAADRVDHAFEVHHREVGAGGEAQPPVEQVLGDLPARAPAAGEDGLQVHRLPEWPRLDVFRLERVAQRFAIRPE